MYDEYVYALREHICTLRGDYRFSQLTHRHEYGCKFCVVFRADGLSAAPGVGTRNRKRIELRFNVRFVRGVPYDERSISPHDLVVVSLLCDEIIEAE